MLIQIWQFLRSILLSSNNVGKYCKPADSWHRHNFYIGIFAKRLVLHALYVWAPHSILRVISRFFLCITIETKSTRLFRFHHIKTSLNLQVASTKFWMKTTPLWTNQCTWKVLTVSWLAFISEEKFQTSYNIKMLL